MARARLVVTLSLALVLPALAANCTDGILNNNETQVDCGGPNCAACPEPSPLPAASPSPSPAVRPVGKASEVFSDTGMLIGIGVASLAVSVIFHVVLVRSTRVVANRAVGLKRRAKHDKKTRGTRGKKSRTPRAGDRRSPRSGDRRSPRAGDDGRTPRNNDTSPRAIGATIPVSVSPRAGGNRSSLHVEDE